MTKLAQQRWADTQKRLESLEKQVRLLFKRLDNPLVNVEAKEQPLLTPEEIAEAIVKKELGYWAADLIREIASALKEAAERER